MTFSDAMAHYRAGTATDDERTLVEEELEKNRLIAEYLDAQWEESMPEPEKAIPEMDTVRKSLRKRSSIIVLTSLVLAAALLLSVVFIGIPAAEKLYWDPNQVSYGGEYAANDLELTIAAYTELFCPDMNIASVYPTKTGFASYDISIQYWNAHRGGESMFATARLEKGVLTFPNGFIRLESMNVFERACYPFYSLDDSYKASTYDKLQELPDYVRVTAAVSFAEDKSMEEIIDLQSRLDQAWVRWVGIRHCPENEQLAPLCGMTPSPFGIVRDQINEAYPCFEMVSTEGTAENLETHFLSLLQFSADQMSKGEGIAENGHTGNYYTEVMDYVKENGIYSYGCYITGSPDAILELLDSGEITQAWVQDAWINF